MSALVARSPMRKDEDPTALLRKVGLRIVELRQGLGWSREELAERLGISARYLGRLEAGGQNLTIHRLVWLASHLSVRAIDLLASPGIQRIQVGRRRERNGERRARLLLEMGSSDD